MRKNVVNHAIWLENYGEFTRIYICHMTPSSSSLPDLEKLRWGYNWFMILAVYILAHCANFVVKIWTALFQTHRRGNQTDIAAKLIFISKSRKNKVNEVSNWLKNSTIFTVTELMICEESIADGAVGKKAKPCQSIDERDLGLMDGIYRKMYPQKRSAKNRSDEKNAFTLTFTLTSW